ncbi:hypothetical protein IFM89_019787 [Coptis chinensis]|uniref:Iron-binding zinc finger CDGSH type domain-containing protein n=1 Tax=Coptis chinensis TaxID=261450 RepID=A0A835ID27_9MAGN|nr:hypothetical protein IFM89_019787 [Coptis chinensis]
MASVANVIGARFTYNNLCPLKINQTNKASSFKVVTSQRGVSVRAEAINTEIRKTEAKVVDSVVVTELSKPLTAYCRCWRSGTFPLCDGSHAKHNKETGDNVGPLLLKKQ